MATARALTWAAGNYVTSQSEREQNALIIYAGLKAKGWSMEAVAATLGNMEYESWINPGVWEDFDYGNTSKGYGLIQWTPATKYINWAGKNWATDHSLQLDRLHYESTCGGLYWVYRNEYPGWTYEMYRQSTEDPYLLACVFAWYAEGSRVVQSGTEAQKETLRQQRGGAALKWYEFLKSKVGNLPAARRKLPVWMMCGPPI